MSKYSGYMGKVMMMDLTTGEVEEYPWTDRDRELYIGGKAMGSKIMFDTFHGTEDPLGPKNIIVITTGPLTGVGAPCSNRFNISTLSPQSGLTTSSNCGGNFGYYLKKAGYDALILKGGHDAQGVLLRDALDLAEALFAAGLGPLGHGENLGTDIGNLHESIVTFCMVMGACGRPYLLKTEN